MLRTIIKALKFDPVSLITFFFCALGAIDSHILIFSERAVKDDRVCQALSLGLSYDVMNAAVLSALCLFICWKLRPAFRITIQGIVVTLYLVFIFIDYIYIQQFGVHLPFSSVEYIKDASKFSATIASVLSGRNFWILAGAPAILYFAFLAVVYKVSAKKSSVTLRGALTTALFLAVVGGVTGCYANSYVSKNLSDPLTSSAALYFHWSRNIEKDEIIAKPEKALQRVVQRLKGKAPSRYKGFPLARTVFPTTCGRPEEQNQAGESLCGVKKPNIILLMLESFRALEVGALGSPIKITPNFDSLSKEGILFTNFYSNGYQTRNGQTASYCSLIPNDGAAIMKAYTRNSYLCLPGILKKIGYSSSWIFASDAAFDNQIHFLPKIGFEKVYDKFSFDPNSEVLGWGYSDKELYKKWFEILDKEKEPFFSSALTITNHHPFDVPDKYKLNIVKSKLNKYYESFYYTDAMLGEFIKEARTKKWHANSLIFVLADTANYQEPQSPPATFEESVINRSRIPLLILGGAVKKPAVIKDYFSQIDLPPTIMDLLGNEYTAPWLGVSMISKESPAAAFTVRPGNYFGVMSRRGRYYTKFGYKDYYYGFPNQAAAQEYKILGESLIETTKWLLQNNLYWPDNDALK